MTKFQSLLRADTMNDMISMNDKGVIEKLINQYLNNNNNGFPKYINDTFASFCKWRGNIMININDLNDKYKNFNSLLLNEQFTNLLRFDKLSQIFINCTKIDVFCNENGINDNKYTMNNITSHFMGELLVILGKINKDGIFGVIQKKLGIL